MQKLFRITTVPISLVKLLENQLGFMKKYYSVTAISSRASELEQVRIKEGISVFSVEMSRKITPISDLKALIQLYIFIRKERPFIVHTHTPKAGVVGMLAAWLAGVPIRLHTVAGLPLLEVTGLKRSVLNLVERITYYCALKVYPNSSELRNIIIKEGFCDPAKLKVLANGSSNGINTALFDSSHFPDSFRKELKISLGINVNDNVFIFVGRLVADKGVNELVRAFKSLQNRHIDSKLLLVGPFEDELDPLDAEVVDEIENNRSIIAVGYQDDVRPYLAISDALVFPSYREGFPNVVMQAGAMGLPCIVSDINGCNEIIVSGENGLIVQPKDMNAVYHAMQSLIEERGLASKLQNNARSMIVERYEQQVVWDAILAEYKQLEKNVQRRIKKTY